eukprot:16436702-Heterocapsa_arctica.AAC.1
MRNVRCHWTGPGDRMRQACSQGTIPANLGGKINVISLSSRDSAFLVILRGISFRALNSSVVTYPDQGRALWPEPAD